MKFKVQIDELLPPLQQVIGVVERRQTLPVLSNLLLVLNEGVLSITATDLEVEMRTSVQVEGIVNGEVTVPARKLVDICKSLPATGTLGFSLAQQRVTLTLGKSRFTLATLGAEEYPKTEEIGDSFELHLGSSSLARLINKTQFAMAMQDVRYYLNGLLFEINPGHIKAVATDGHRLAMASHSLDTGLEAMTQVIVPRKAVQELMRLLGTGASDIHILVASNHIRFSLGSLVMTAKLIDGRFPDYDRVIPSELDKVVIADREQLRQSLQRVSILSNEKYRGVRLSFSPQVLHIQAHNPDQEEAEEEVEVGYSGAELEVGFNVSYLIEAIGVLEHENIQIELGGPNSSALLTDNGSDECRYVVMPMRL